MGESDSTHYIDVPSIAIFPWEKGKEPLSDSDHLR